MRVGTKRRNVRSWRIVAAALMLLIAVVAGCGLMTRTDARFVGKWKVDSSTPDGSYLHPWGTIEFRSNGTAVMQGPGDPTATIPFPWSAEMNSLTFGEKWSPGPGSSAIENGLWELSSNWRSLWAGSAQFGLDEATYEIQSCTSDRIQILEEGWEHPFVLTRIP
jgi:hypothetical protein